MRKISLILLLTFIVSAFGIFSVSAEVIVKNALEEINAGMPDAYANCTVSATDGIGGTNGSTSLTYNNVDFGGEGIGGVHFFAATNPSYPDGVITLRLDDPSSAPIAECLLPGTGGWTAYRWLKFEFDGSLIFGEHTVYITMSRDGTCNLKSFTFVPYVEKIELTAPIDISGTKYEEAFSVMNSLGFIDHPDFNVEFKPEDKVNVETFLNTVLPLGGNVTEEIYTQYLSDYKLSGKDIMTKTAATEIALDMLFYSGKGLYTSARTYANSLGVFKSISLSDDEFTKGEMLRFMYNLSHINIMEPESITYKKGNYGVTYKISDFYTLLSKNHNIYYEKSGIVDGTPLTFLDGENNSLMNDTVSIDGYKYISSGTKAASYLGYNVEYYFKHEDDPEKSNTLLYIAPTGKNNVITVSAENIKDFSDMTLTYMEDDKKKTEKIPYGTKVIYNGMATIKYTNKTFEPLDGDVTVLDNNGDDSADVVFINDTVDYVARVVSDNKIYIKNDFDLCIDLSSADYLISDTNGADIGLSGIVDGSLLTVGKATGVDGSVRYKIVVSKRVLIAPVNEVNTKDKYVKIGEKELEISNAIYEKNKFNDFIAGETVKILLNAYGKIGYVEARQSDALAYLIAYKRDTGIDDILSFKLFTENGQMLVADAKSRLQINGSYYSSSEAAVKYLDSTVGEKNRLVMFSTNTAGEIIDITLESDLTENPAAVPATNLIAKFDGVVKYKNEMGSAGGKFIIMSDTRMFMIPQSGEDEGYYIGNVRSIGNDTSPTMRAYYPNMDTLIPNAVVTTYNDKSADIIQSSWDYIVADKAIVLNNEGEPAGQLTYYDQENLKTIIVADYIMDLYNDLDIGDVFKMSPDRNGYAGNIIKCFDIKNRIIEGGYSNGFSAESQHYYGKVQVYESGIMKIEGVDELINALNGHMFVYDTESETVRKGERTEIVDSLCGGDEADEVFMYARYSGVRYLYIIK